MKKAITPYELVGMTHDDFVKYCKSQNISIINRESKKKFFKLVDNKQLTKQNNELYLNGEKL